MKRTKEQVWCDYIDRLRRKAFRAALAQEAFSDALEKAKERRDWEAMCEAHGIAPDADAGDWMC